MSGVLVTGAGGFVGRPVLRALAGGPDQLHALSRSSEPAPIEGVTWHQLDLGDGAAVRSLLNELRPERLVHLAWYVEHGQFWAAPENVQWVEWSLRLLRAFIAAGGRRAVMLGSCAEYDWTAAASPLHETRSRIDPGTLYGVSKDALRRVASALAERERVELAWGRLFFLYGPAEPPARLFASVVGALLEGDRVQTTNGTQRRDFLHVDDVGRAVAELLSSDVTGPVNIASGEPIAIGEVLDLIGDALARPELIERGARPEVPGEPSLLVADTARLQGEVGFHPRLSLAEGLAATIAATRVARGAPDAT